MTANLDQSGRKNLLGDVLLEGFEELARGHCDVVIRVMGTGSIFLVAEMDQVR